MRNRDRGYSLIELLFVVVVCAIILTIGVGSYDQALRRTNRVDAMRALLRIAEQQERFFLDHRRYAKGTAELGVADISQRGFYTLAIETDPVASQYRASATAIRGTRQSADRNCSVLETDEAGRQAPRDCWR